MLEPNVRRRRRSQPRAPPSTLDDFIAIRDDEVMEHAQVGRDATRGFIALRAAPWNAGFENVRLLRLVQIALPAMQSGVITRRFQCVIVADGREARRVHIGALKDMARCRPKAQAPQLLVVGLGFAVLALETESDIARQMRSRAAA